jgi:hypothetical protein
MSSSSSSSKNTDTRNTADDAGNAELLSVMNAQRERFEEHNAESSRITAEEQMKLDEELARKLQMEMDLEGGSSSTDPPPGVAADPAGSNSLSRPLLLPSSVGSVGLVSGGGNATSSADENQNSNQNPNQNPTNSGNMTHGNSASAAAEDLDTYVRAPIERNPVPERLLPPVGYNPSPWEMATMAAASQNPNAANNNPNTYNLNYAANNANNNPDINNPSANAGENGANANVNNESGTNNADIGSMIREQRQENAATGGFPPVPPPVGGQMGPEGNNNNSFTEDPFEQFKCEQRTLRFLLILIPVQIILKTIVGTTTTIICDLVLALVGQMLFCRSRRGQNSNAAPPSCIILFYLMSLVGLVWSVVAIVQPFLFHKRPFRTYMRDSCPLKVKPIFGPTGEIISREILSEDEEKKYMEEHQARQEKMKQSTDLNSKTMPTRTFGSAAGGKQFLSQQEYQQLQQQQSQQKSGDDLRYQDGVLKNENGEAMDVIAGPGGEKVYVEQPVRGRL